MKKAISVAVLLLVVLSLAGCSPKTGDVINKTTGTTTSKTKHPRWEYYVLDTRNSRGFINVSADTLNRLGESGWELVTSSYDDLIFKRRLP